MFTLSGLSAVVPRYARLRDGSRCRIRTLTEGDRHLLVEFFERWSPSSRRLRFLATKRELTQADLDFFTSADGVDHIALTAVRANAPGEEEKALGFARCIRLKQAPDTAEMSIAVADEVQRLGVGSALLDRLTALARRAGIRRFVCDALAENSGMRALARRMGGKIDWQGDGTVEHNWPLPVSTPVDDEPWSTDPHQALGESLAFWLTLADQVVHIGIDYWEAMRWRFADPRSLADLRLPGYWASSPGTSLEPGVK